MIGYICQMYNYYCYLNTILVILNLPSPGILPPVYPPWYLYKLLRSRRKTAASHATSLQCNFELYIDLYIMYNIYYIYVTTLLKSNLLLLLLCLLASEYTSVSKPKCTGEGQYESIISRLHCCLECFSRPNREEQYEVLGTAKRWRHASAVT